MTRQDDLALIERFERLDRGEAHDRLCALARLGVDAEKLYYALAFYADPATYHAVAFFFDPPCGDFRDDFSHDDEYGREMPGKYARETLNADARAREGER